MKDRSEIVRTARGTAPAARNGGWGLLRLYAGGVPLIVVLLSLSFFFILIPTPAWSATPPGTIISNAASATYAPGALGTPVTAQSNTASVTTIARRTASVLELLQYAPGVAGAQLVSVASSSYSTSATVAGPFVLSPPPAAAGGAPISLSGPVPLIPVSQYHAGEPVFIRLTDGDQNNDPLAAEIVFVTVRDPATGDTEVLRLAETGPNSGVFTGYVQSSGQPPVSGNGILSVSAGSGITASYLDVVDNADARAATVMVDPYGMVFSSSTGQPVNGAVVTLVNTATSGPAVVYGDDGVSIFPSSMTTGGTAADSGGAAYGFAAGQFRFPYVLPGTYRLVVQPPAGFRAPSAVPTPVLQALPGGPFAIAAPGSRGEPFIVSPGPAFRIDIPVDPTSSGLYLSKTAGKDTASIGDFVPYSVTVENVSTAVVPSVVVTDRLPAGFRYRKGSARMNSAVLADPVISGDGRSLTFSIGNVAAGTSAIVTYVTEVGAGAGAGLAVNTAVATGAPGIVSNPASAAVLIIEDLFGSKATIMGRISVGCDDRNGVSEGVAGVRIYLEDGTYAVTDRNGMYHFAAVRPGTHVVQLDTVTMPGQFELLACEENSRFAGTNFSQFVDLQGGTLWRADFRVALKPQLAGSVSLELQSEILSGRTEENGAERPAGTDDRAVRVLYALPVHVEGVAVTNLRLAVMLPASITYVPGSTTLNGAPFSDPQIIADTLTFRVSDAPAGWDGTFRFEVMVPSGGDPRELTTRALLTVDTPAARNERTAVVENALELQSGAAQGSLPDIVLHPRFATLSADLSGSDRQEIERAIAELRKMVVKHITITGHTDAQPIRGKGREKFADNYVLSRARAATVARDIAAALGLSPEQITIVGKGPDEPVAPNATAEGRALNRRVEITVESRFTTSWSAVRNVKDRSGVAARATVGQREGAVPVPDLRSASPANRTGMPDYNAAWLETAKPGNEWLWPVEGWHPPIANTKIAVKHDPASRLRLSLNGREVDGIYFDGSVKKADGTAAVSVWRGIPLAEGDNRLELAMTDPSGAETARIERILHYSGPPVHVELVPDRSRLIADGRSPAVIAIRLFDKEGHPSREGLTGEYSIDPPHQSAKKMADLQQSPLVAPATERLRYEVGPDGIAFIELAPTTQTGEAVLRFPLDTESREVRAWLKPEDRDWILVGLAEGTIGYSVVSGNMETFSSTGEDEHLYEDGRIAFYAKGRVKGEWLLTMAYDSKKESTDGRPSMYQTVDPNKYYVLYGDATDQRYDAASAKRIYIKLERDQFYALFGDFPTGLTVTELSRYNRNLTGFKSEFKGRQFEYNVFVSQTNQAFVKDEIQGDGTSGLYHLSRRNIVINSETVTIETRDRFRSEVIISRQRLSRFLDYSIDYDAGTVFFKSPVFSRDGNFNPVFIVAEYESFDPSDTSYTYGGRAAAKTLDERVQVGVTRVHEGLTGGQGDLTGADMTVDLKNGTKVRAEVAATKTDQPGASAEGSAYLAEVQHRSETLDGHAYVRQQEPGFGLGQQNGSETGMRKIGADIAYRIDRPWTLGGEIYRQDNLATGAVRDLAEVNGRYIGPRYTALAGIRRVEDLYGDGMTLRSDELFAGIQYRFTERLTGRVQHDQLIGGGSGSLDFPTRTTAGVEYRLNQATTFFADQEYTQSSQQDTATSRVGMRTSPWTGAQLGSTMEQQTTENGARLFSTTGLKQTWQITKQWSIDGGLDRAATIYNTTTPVPSLNPNVPPASGSTEDFTAVTLGAAYREETWSWTGRMERRISDTEEKVGLYMGANGEVRQGLALAAGLQSFRTDSTAGLLKFTGDLRFGVAYRPAETRIILLDRFDCIREEQHGADPAYDNWRLVNNLVVNLKTDARAQVSLQYGAKYVRETIDQSDYRGYTDLTGIEGRYDITKKWDVGVRGSMLHSWAISQMQYGSSVSVGFAAARNLWISVGYNLTGFYDRDFSKAEFTSEGPFIKLRMKFDQVSVREAVRWITGQ